MSETWQSTTRAGHHVRNVRRIGTGWRGEVCLRTDCLPSVDPKDWQIEMWYPDGTYYGGQPKSFLDLVATNEGGAIVTNPKWEIGPVKLIDGTEGYIEFVQPESELYRYIGRVKFNGSEWRASHWCDAGRVPYSLTGNPKNLAPPPKKTVRVQLWVNVYADGQHCLHASKESALAGGEHARFACIEIDREVTEGEGL